jgi:predicted transcriptional regulator
MSSTNVKQEARRLVDNLPENATWDDLMYAIYVRQAIEAGLADSEAGRILDVKAVRAKFGLSQGESMGPAPPWPISSPSMSISPEMRRYTPSAP